MQEATDALAEAAKLLPDRASVHYNYGLALQQMGRKNRPRSFPARAQRLDPDDPTVPYALSVFYAQSGTRERALQWAETLLALRPGDPQVHRLIASLQAMP